MPRTVSQINYAHRRAKRFRSAGLANGGITPAPVVDKLTLARLAVEEIHKALCDAGIFNIGSIESRPRRLEFKYRCPGWNCAQHGSRITNSDLRITNGGTEGGIDCDGKLCGDRSPGGKGCGASRTGDQSQHSRDNQLSPNSTPCPVIGVLIRLVNAGVLSKVHGRAGGVAWSPSVQLCKHTRSGMAVHFESMSQREFQPRMNTNSHE